MINLAIADYISRSKSIIRHWEYHSIPIRFRIAIIRVSNIELYLIMLCVINQTQMKNVLLTLIITFVEFTACAQGSWDIGYIEVDSIRISDVGRAVKLDFKHIWAEQGEPRSKSIRKYVTPEDTNQIIVDGNKVNLIEKRKIYVDHGSFNDQYLELESEDPNVSVRIYSSVLQGIEKDKLKFSVVIETFEVKKEKLGKKVKTETFEIWVDKKDLDGLMVKK